ncbi:hypothetical protein F5Y03DRAFT_342401 [Xylaria venustula]|nr:hypothetical protein F5Y03DRAFT_342401 [Xylaria venustula]
MVSSHSNSPKPDALKHTTTAATAETSFTPEMRDRQARGKNPYHSDSEDSDWLPAPDRGSGGENDNGDGTRAVSSRNVLPARIGVRKDESFAVYDRRRVAAQVLDNPELLMMAAVRDSTSIPATRLKYARALCGVGELSTPSSRTRTGPRTSTGTETPRSSTAEKQRKRTNQDR